MKKWIGFLMLMVLLTGCGTEQTAETIADELLMPVMAEPALFTVDLPGETAMPVFENDHGRVYICNDYEIVVQTLPAGDLSGTMQTVSGKNQEDLTVMETQGDGVRRYEFVWASAGETGDRSGRAVILEDDNYHYCLSILRDADGEKSQVNWDQVFSSFHLV